MNLLTSLVGNVLGQVVVTLIMVVPAMMIALLVYRRRKEYRAAASEPFTQLPLRPPGESVRIAIERLEE
jgi:hypothetical protein